MHFECRLAGKNGGQARPIWFYKWGFTVWINRLIFGFGHDTRDQKQTTFDCWLSPADKPIVSGLESYEVVYAKDQPEYIPLRTLVSRDHQRRVLSRWTPTKEQRKAIADGADIFLFLMTFGHPLQPIQIMVAPEINRDYVVSDFGFNPDPPSKISGGALRHPTPSN